MKNLFTLLLMSSLTVVYSQVGINTELPKASLEVASSPNDISVTDGVVIPRLTGDQLRSKDSLYELPQNSTLVYVTVPVSQSSTKTRLVTSPGFYYYEANAAEWRALGSTVLKSQYSLLNSSRKTLGPSTAAGTARTLTFIENNLLPPSSLYGSWDGSVFTVTKKGLYTVTGGVKLRSTNSAATGAVFMNAGGVQYGTGSQRTQSGTTYYINANLSISVLLDPGDKISMNANSGNAAWNQGESFINITYTEMD